MMRQTQAASTSRGTSASFAMVQRGRKLCHRLLLTIGRFKPKGVQAEIQLRGRKALL